VNKITVENNNIVHVSHRMMFQRYLALVLLFRDWRMHV